ncbi:MAG: hypothetical protein PHU95_01735 [Candidatus Thermoplasmatota archaeon]|nr:hypothetical protein [Candidatus Thermoplasmatota archaeon]
MLVLLLVACLALGGLTAADRLYVDRAVNTDPATDHTDNQLYVQRAQTILDGELLYRDVETQTPPLINYLLVPPVALGGSPLAFEIYFSFFIALTVLALFAVLSRLDEKKALWVALAFLFVPTTLVTPTLARQDESIVVFFFLLPLLLMYVSRSRHLYALFAALGIWLKMHSVFLVLPLLLKSNRRQALQEMGVMAGVSLAVTLPFFLLALDQFVWHLRFYLLGEGDEALQGISLWRILESQGYAVPSLLLIGVMGTALLVIYYHSYRYRLGIWKTVALTLLAYFVLYPKIHYEYFLILFAVLIPLLIESKKMMGMTYGMAALSGITLLIEQRYLDWGTASAHDAVMVALAGLCMAALDVLLVLTFRHLLTTRTWLDGKPLF